MSTPVRPRLADLPPEKRRLLEARLLAARRGAAAGPARLPRAEGENEFPATPGQRRLWVLDRMDPGNGAYNLPFVLRLTGELDPALLERTFDALRARHESLRTVFRERDGVPVQVVLPPTATPLPVTDLRSLPPAERARVASRESYAHVNDGFDLAAGPLLRARLLRLGDDEHLLLACLHHIVGDGWSMGVLERELTALHAAFRDGRGDPLPPLPLQFGDWAAWQARAREAGAAAAHLAFWRDALAGAPPALDLPADRPRPAVETHRGGRIRFSVDEATAGALRALALREEATLFAVLLAAWRAVLGSRAGQEDVVVGTPVAGRGRRELEGLIGFFVDMLPLRTSLAGDPSFAALVRRERLTLLDALDHQDVPFERIVEALDAPRDTSRNPLFQASFSLQREAEVGVSLAGTEAEGEEVAYDFSKFDVGLDVMEAEGRLWMMIEFASDLFDRAPVQEMADAFARVLERGAADPGAPLAALLAPAADEAARTAAWGTAPPVPPVAAPVHRAFEAWAARAPDAPAVVYPGGAWSYAELDRRATALARRLRDVGVGMDRPVGVLAGHGPGAVAALLAVMKAGGAWMPLDPDGPAQRTAALLRGAGAAALLVVDGTADGIDADVPVLRADAAPAEDDGSPLPEVAPGALAYVLFTSGSTGLPRPVGVEHRALAGHLASTAARYGIRPGDRVLAFAALTFDPSLEQLLVPLTAGASVALRGPGVPGPAEFAAMVEEMGVTVANPPTAYLHALAEDPAALARVRRAVRLLIAGGEPLRPDTAAAWSSLAEGAPLLNAYGPTEAVVTCAAWEVPPAWIPLARVPVGAPLPGRVLAVLDRWLRPAAAGVPGELFVGGGALARGYLRRAAATAAAFVPDPCSPLPGARMYRTGDLARWRTDGALDFLGRADQQVKVRGFRIEPGEIEAALLGHPAVRDAAVVARTGAAGTRIDAYAAGPGVDVDDVLDHLRRVLPEPMVPATLTRLDRLPVTPNGKVDRRALPEPERTGEGAHEPPATPTERRLAEAWRDLLGVERVGRGDDFFSLGGHSLLGARLVARVRDETGVALPLRELFEHRTLAALAERVDADAPDADLAPIPRADRAGPLPLSFAQERLWFLEQLDPGSAFYNVPVALELRGPMDEEALGRALAELARRHEVLRTAFEPGEGGPTQRILAPGSVRMQIVDLSAVAGEDREREAVRRAGEEARRPFDLRGGPLMRAVLLRLAPERRVLVLVLHHAATDATTGGILLREMAALYEAFRAGLPSPFPEPALQYADFAAWQRGWLRGEALDRQLAYWRERLAGAPAKLDLPTDRPRPPVQDLRGATHHFMLGAEAAAAVRALAEGGDATAFMVLAAAFAGVMHRWSGEDDLVLGTPTTVRPRRELEEVAGFFGNTLPLRLELGGDPGFAALLARVREAVLGAFGHADVPFEKLVEAIGTERSLGHSPVFQVMVAHQAAGGGAPARFGDAEVGFVDAPLNTSRFDLTVGFVEGGDEIGGWVEYATALFDPDTVERLVAHLDALLRSAALDPRTPVADLPLLAPRERECVVRSWNATAAPRPDESVYDLFAATAARTPDAVAVEWRGEARSYAQVAARAGGIAARLREMGVGPEVRVALALERGIDLPAAVLGVLRAGGAYVAVDPAYPAERIAYMLEDSRAAVLVTTREVAGRLPGATPPLLLLDGPGTDGALSGDLPRTDPDSLAYVIYTSGSTGRPKGAALPHRALANLVRWQLGRWGEAGAARTLQFASLSFDVSFQEIFCTWAAGGTLVLVDDETRRDGEALLAYLREARVERVFLPFAALQNLAEAAEGAEVRLPALSEIVTAGEALRATPQLRAFLRANPGLRVDNQYGPSETHVVSAHRPPADADGWPLLPPIGRPVENARLYVLDARMRPAPVGVPGELYAAGSPLGRGYLAWPGLTAERWLPDPFAPEPGGRLYRTGDRARWTAAGALEYLGRADAQVKIRGFRVEPGEVEAALGSHPGVRDAAVAVRGEGAERRLVAYVVPGGGAADTEALRAHLAAVLPEYMVPAAWVVMDGLPRTPSGKTDRRRLPEPEARAATGGVPPRTPAEEMVAAIWERVLGVRPGAHDDFFALGGHSLRATRVMSRVREAFGVELPLRALFESPTVAGLAAKALAARAGGAAAAPPLRPREGHGPAPLSFAQQRFWFVERMGAAGNAYTIPVSLRLGGALDAAALARALGALVERHESLRTVFRTHGGEPVQVVLPAGPHLLPVDDLAAGGDAEAAAERIVAAEVAAPFDLERGPVFRARLLRIAPDEHLLLVVFHHVAADGWSLGIFFRELAALYAAGRDGGDAALPPLPVQYADFAVWQRARLSGPALDDELEHWRKALAGAATLELPTDRPRPPVQSFRGGSVPVEIGPELSAAVAELARSSGATVFMVLLAALDLLLHRWSGSTDVVVGTPVAARTPRETEGLIGIFLNTLALRVELGGDPTFAGVLARVRTAALDAFAHQDLPFERLLEALGTGRSLSRHPLFQVLFSMQPESDGGSADFAGLAVRAEEPEVGAAKLDLALAVAEEDGALRGALQYAADLWDDATARRMARQFRTLLAAAVADPSRPASSLPLLEAADREELLAWGRGTRADHGPGALHRRVEGWAARHPDAPAVDAPDAALTFAELDRAANRLAHRLRRLGIGPDRPVGVMMERSAALLVAQLAVMKAGGAYLPLDPAAPPERNGRMLRDASAALVVARSVVRGSEVSGVPVLLLDREEAALAAEPDDAPAVEVHPDHLAYLFFTSGSTGVPKGVAVPHRGVSNLAGWYARAFGFAPGDRAVAMAAPTFDISVLETWCALANGAAVHVVPEPVRTDPTALLRWMDGEGITVAVPATPVAEALLEALERGAAPPRALRLLLTGGDALRRRAPAGIRLVNQYGPTENSVASTAGVVDLAREGLPTIGVPVDNHRCLVMDEFVRPVPVGIPGELYVGGPGLARGYAGRPGRTAVAFVPSPLPDAPGERLYRTGDRVRWLVSGELEFLGRVDQQVKLRGHRIEPGEVEAALLAHPAVAEAAVVLRGAGGAARLVAYVAPPAPADALRTHLRERLPDYMVPAAFVSMDALPVTPNGKVDRRALPEPAAEPRPDAAPRSGPERRIAGVWAEVLGVERVALDDNFFEIGGHSLLVARLAERLGEELGRVVSLVDVFQFPTVGALAAHLGAGAGDVASGAEAGGQDEAGARGAGRRDRMRRMRR